MAEKLIPYDPAEDLGSDEAIAMFMAEAFVDQRCWLYIARAGCGCSCERDGPNRRADRRVARAAVPFFQ